MAKEEQLLAFLLPVVVSLSICSSSSTADSWFEMVASPAKTGTWAFGICNLAPCYPITECVSQNHC